MTSSVAILDYGMGNLHSITKALQHVAPQANIRLTHDPEVIAQAERVVFPGVGAIRDCMASLRRLGLTEVIRSAARSKPLLGICLGLQALFDYSEENGGVECLGVIPGTVKRFNFEHVNFSGVAPKIPHMGWNTVHHEKSHPLWEGIADDARFYFVHSYYAAPTSSESVVGTTPYATNHFACGLAIERAFAVQFHPEKSQDVGLRLLANFLAWQPG